MDMLEQMVNAGWSIRVHQHDGMCHATASCIPLSYDNIIEAQDSNVHDCIISLYAAWQMREYTTTDQIGLPLFEVPS